MNLVRIVILAIALSAAGAAAFIARSLVSSRDSVAAVDVAPVIPAGPALVGVLVAANDIPVGARVRAEDLDWREWPESAAAEGFLTDAESPDAVDELSGGLAMRALVAGEPVLRNKIAGANGAGVLSVMLRKGMRAYAVEVSPESGAGGFILPGDRVDVLVTRQVERADPNNPLDKNRVTLAESVLGNVRVLAIDQQLSERDGEGVVVGRTATLELSPKQTEIMALADAIGEIVLTLRGLSERAPRDAARPAVAGVDIEAIEDAPVTLSRLIETPSRAAPGAAPAAAEQPRGGSVRVVRAGVPYTLDVKEAK